MLSDGEARDMNTSCNLDIIELSFFWRGGGGERERKWPDLRTLWPPSILPRCLDYIHNQKVRRHQSAGYYLRDLTYLNPWTNRHTTKVLPH